VAADRRACVVYLERTWATYLSRWSKKSLADGSHAIYGGSNVELVREHPSMPLTPFTNPSIDRVRVYRTIC